MMSYEDIFIFNLVKNYSTKDLKKFYVFYKNRCNKNINLLRDIIDKNNKKYLKTDFKMTSCNNDFLLAKKILRYASLINLYNCKLIQITNNEGIYINLEWHFKIAISNYLSYNEYYLKQDFKSIFLIEKQKLTLDNKTHAVVQLKV